MKKRGLTLVISVLLAFLLVISFSACGKTSEPSDQTASQSTAQQTAEVAKEPVTIKVTTQQFGTDQFAPVFSAIKKDFAEKYKDKIILNVEEIPNANYADKLRVYVSADQLPDYITNANFQLLDLGVAESGKVVDLTPYLDANPEFKANFKTSTMEFNSRNGKVYGLACYAAEWGLEYNTEIFEKAGIAEPAKTWDEFWANCDKIIAAGYIPLAIDTEGWPVGNLFAALIGSQGGEAEVFMNSAIIKAKDFNKPYVIEAVRQIQIAFQKYTSKDAIGGKWDNSANNILSGKAAILPCGQLFLSDFQDTKRSVAGLDQKMKHSLFPNETKISACVMGDYIGSKTTEQADATWEFMMFKMGPDYQRLAFELASVMPESPNVVLSDEERQKQPLQSQLVEICRTAVHVGAPYDNIMYTNVQDELPRLYPELATGNITPEDFCARLTELSQKN